MKKNAPYTAHPMLQLHREIDRLFDNAFRGEKKGESETKDRHYYRIERSYGSFQRVLALPDDCEQSSINASMKNGVLDISIARKALPASATKRIPIN